MLDGSGSPQRLDVRVALRAAAEHEQPARRPARRGGGPRALTRPRSAAFVRAIAVHQRDRRQRRGVEHHADALDPRLAADGHELHDGMPRGAGRHHEQLAAVDLDHRRAADRPRGRARPAAPPRALDGAALRRAAARPRPRRGDGSAHRSTKPVPSGSRGSRTNRCSPVRNAVPSTSVSTPSSPRRWPGRGTSCHDRVVAPRLALGERAVGEQQRGARRGGRARRRAVDLAVGEDRHVALVQRADLLVEDRPVDARQPVVGGVAGELVVPRARALISRPIGDQLREVGGHRRAARGASAGTKA